ncbi:F-box/kelch-repeat protein [Raphanus sativus]|uniref:F-box/kelch-repeat protein At4g19930-like n=1 Tax=Raphanus sativus TaxID=3726 RepID=A0A6J0N5Q0_RAPSA|nr:F-box/kelch-repeat protein At4g19930-like [Raphanus sativus]KAJ4903116.1 F-box/kelch-repeat protein [Raphanus sativus]
MFLREGRKGREICKSHELPYELVIEILTRLPAKSLMRFKSVSKLWSSIICSQYFTDGRLKVSSSPQRIYMWLSFNKSPSQNVSVLLSSSSPADDTTMSSFVVDQNLTIPSMEGYFVSQVFCGLMCFINGPSAKIYNTTTRQLVVLPDIEGSNIVAEDRRNKKFMYHIGHDPLHNQYKVLCIVSAPIGICSRYTSEQWVLVLGGDGSSRWRNISNPCPSHCPFTQRLTIKGRVYYLAWIICFHRVLVCFDICSEEISMFQVPEGNAPWHFALYTELIEYGGRVAVLYNEDFDERGVMELWVRDDAEKNLWSKKTFVLDPSQMHLLNGIRFRVQGTTRNGEVILVPQNTSRNPTTCEMIVEDKTTTRFHLFLYNLQNNHLRKVEIKDTSNRYLTNMWDIIGLDDVENLRYL